MVSRQLLRSGKDYPYFYEERYSVVRDKYESIEANAKAGKYRATCAPFGYTKGDDSNHLPVIDPDAAPIVKSIFEMRAIGISPHHIADKLNEDGVPIPSDYYYAKLGKPNPRRTRHLWSSESVRQILHNYTYLRLLVQLCTTISYKNHKTIKRDEEDMIVVKNTHEPIGLHYTPHIIGLNRCIIIL